MIIILSYIIYCLKREERRYVWVAFDVDDFKMKFCGILERKNGDKHNNDIIIDHQHNY